MKIRFVLFLAFIALSATELPAQGIEGLFNPDSQLVMQIKPTARMDMGTSVTPGSKSRAKAFFLSLLLPGLGERYVGYHGKSELFMASEAALWLGYAGFRMSYDWHKDDYIAFAAAHAGADVAGKENAFFLDMENYDNIDEFNAAKLRQRTLYEYYYDTDTYYWDWDTLENQRRFSDLRVTADRIENRATLTLGLIVANHLISAIDAMWSVHRYNNAQSSSNDWSIQLGDGRVQPTVRLSLSHQF